MTIREVRKALGKPVRFRSDRLHCDGTYILSGCTIRRRDGWFAYQAELLRDNHVIIADLNDIERIDFAPTVDAGEWIPCSERLPEGGREVLAVCNGFDGTGNPKQMYVLAAIKNGRWIETWGLAALAFDVVKWKYMPELNGGAYNA